MSINSNTDINCLLDDIDLILGNINHHNNQDYEDGKSNKITINQFLENKKNENEK
jgi:mannitol-specific phosphotransferase system IIBC component